MSAARFALIALAAAAAGPAMARPPVETFGGVYLDAASPDEGTSWGIGAGPNAFFYPDGYDPQYGSEGRVPDATAFAAGYGCRPIWNAKIGRTIPACN